jgi:uncharacterized protein (UPF0147 family)
VVKKQDSDKFTNIIFNPAQQLLEILPPNIPQNFNGIKIIEAWSKILNIPTKRRTSLFYAMSRVATLPDLTSDYIETIRPDNPEIFLGWVAHVRAGLLENNFNNTFNHVFDTLNQERRNTIAICAQLISDHTTNLVLSKEERAALNDIYNQIWVLIDQISQSELPLNIKRFCLKQLETLDQTIIDLKISGSKASAESFSSMVGLIVLNQETFLQAKDTDLGSKFVSLVGKFTMFVNTLQGTEYLLDKASGASDMVIKTIKLLTDGS